MSQGENIDPALMRISEMKQDYRGFGVYNFFYNKERAKKKTIFVSRTTFSETEIKNALNEAEKERKMNKYLLVCAMLIGMFVFVGCGEQSEKAEQASQASQKGQAGQAGQAKQSSPTQAFNEWRNAIIAGKIDVANGLTGKGEALMNAMYVEAVKDNVAEGKILKSGTITGEEIKGDKAIIKMKGEGGKTADFVMVKTQGKWKISHEE